VTGKQPTGSEPNGKADMTIIIETSEGTITAELDAEKAPVTVENFLRYSN